MVLFRLLSGQAHGFYVDIGAHHPERFSNTKFYYDRGWRGINVEADPTLFAAFQSERPRDINLSLGVGSKPGKLTFYQFNEQALNTFLPKVAKEKAKIPGYKIVSRKAVQIQPLSVILKKHLPKDQPITFFSIDVEGLDLEVLKSNDWKLYRPEFILVESWKPRDLDALDGDPIVKFLSSQDYEPVAKTFYTIFFKARERKM